MKNFFFLLAAAAFLASCAPKTEPSIVGHWVEPNPIDASSVQGFALHADHTASSINMATLVCSSWTYENDTLRLTLTSIGNAIESTQEEAFLVTKLDADSLVLSQNGTVAWQLKRHEAVSVQ